MSFDLAVWKGDDDRTLPSDSEARETYVDLCNDASGGGSVVPESKNSTQN